jgi:hypothetical protein
MRPVRFSGVISESEGATGMAKLFGYRRFGGMDQTRCGYGLSFDD